MFLVVTKCQPVGNKMATTDGLFSVSIFLVHGVRSYKFRIALKAPSKPNSTDLCKSLLPPLLSSN